MVGSPEEFFDIISTIKGGQFVTVGYVTSANLNVPQERRKNPETNRMKNFDDYVTFGKNLGEEGEIGGVIKFTSYNMNWRNNDDMAAAYSKYVTDRDAIRAKYGVESRTGGYTDKVNFGDAGGIKTYDGDNEALKSHTYTAQNTFSARKKSAYYLVSTEGNIVREIPIDQLKAYMKGPQAVAGVGQLKKMGADEAQIESYIKEISELKMNYMHFEHSSILYIVATVNGIPLIYINEKLTQSVRGININPTDFINIAKEKYKKDLEDVGDTVTEIEEGTYFHKAQLSEEVSKAVNLMKKINEL